MYRRPALRVLPNLSVLTVLAVLGCRATPSGSSGPYQKGVNSSGKPCPPNASQKVASNQLQLTGSDMQPAIEGEKSAALFRTIRNGGYVTVGFWGIPTDMDQFKAKGNERGFVDVLNIPYCTQGDSFKTDGDLWLKRCLSFKTKYELGLVSDEVDGQKKFNPNGAVAKAKFISNLQRPAEVFKICTAHFSMDAEDTQAKVEQRRVRVWTAEHCYQPAYSTRVTANMWVAAEKLNSKKGVYVPIVLDQLDGVLWREKVLAVGGGKGDASDPKLAEKLLILRSTDGRSSDVYRKTFDKYCVGGKDISGLPKFDNGEVPTMVDCFSVSDVGTFKGTVNVSSTTQDIKQNQGGIGVDKSQDARKVALNFLFSDSLESAHTDLDRALADNLPSFIGRQLTVSKFVTSIFDGLQYARRKRAYMQELRELDKTDPKLLETTLTSFRDLFSMVVMDISKNDIMGIVNGVVSSLCSGIGADCSKREFGPLDTRWMEDVALGRPPPGFDDFISQRVNIALAKLLNNKFVKVNDPLRVNALDSQFLSNLKVTSFQLKLLLDVVLMRNDPLGGGVATVLQKLVKLVSNSCSTPGIGSRWYPIMGNFSVAEPIAEENTDSFKMLNNRFYSRVAPVSFGSQLRYVPIGMEVSNYAQPACHSWAGAALGIGVPINFPGFSKPVIVPRETVYALHGDESGLNAPESAEPQAVTEEKLVNYLSSRVMLKFMGGNGNSFFSASPGDSGVMSSFMGFPMFLLSAHNWNAVNGIVLAEPPDLNDPASGDSSSGSLCK